MTTNKVCGECGNVFVARHGNQASCSAACRKARDERLKREWRLKHPQAGSAARKRYREKHPDEVRAANRRAYARKSPEQRRAQHQRPASPIGPIKQMVELQREDEWPVE